MADTEPDIKCDSGKPSRYGTFRFDNPAGLRPNQRVVIAAMSAHGWTESGVVWSRAGAAQIADMLGCTDRSIRKIVASLGLNEQDGAYELGPAPDGRYERVRAESGLWKISPTELIVYLAVRSFTAKPVDGNPASQCWASTETIAKRAGLGFKATKNAISTLRESGLIRVVTSYDRQAGVRRRSIGINRGAERNKRGQQVGGIEAVADSSPGTQKRNKRGQQVGGIEGQSGTFGASERNFWDLGAEQTGLLVGTKGANNQLSESTLSKSDQNQRAGVGATGGASDSDSDHWLSPSEGEPKPKPKARLEEMSDEELEQHMIAKHGEWAGNFAVIIKGHLPVDSVPPVVAAMAERGKASGLTISHVMEILDASEEADNPGGYAVQCIRNFRAKAPKRHPAAPGMNGSGTPVEETLARRNGYELATEELRARMNGLDEQVRKHIWDERFAIKIERRLWVLRGPVEDILNAREEAEPAAPRLAEDTGREASPKVSSEDSKAEHERLWKDWDIQRYLHVGRALRAATIGEQKAAVAKAEAEFRAKHPEPQLATPATRAIAGVINPVTVSLAAIGERA